MATITGVQTAWAVKRNREWNILHPEKMREYSRRYYAAHKEQEREKNRKYLATHPERVEKKYRAWRAKNTEYDKERGRKWKAEHPEAGKRNSREWRAKNPNKIIEYQAHRRALKKNASGAGMTARQWEQIKKDYNYLCAYCGQKRKLTPDHVVSLFHGGRHDIDNIAPACKPSNSSKGHLPLLYFMFRKVSKGNTTNG